MIKGKYNRTTTIADGAGISTFKIEGIVHTHIVASYKKHLEIEAMINLAFETGYKKALKEIRKQISRVEKKSGCF